MENDYAIILNNISKKYLHYKNKTDRLKEALHPLKKKFHKDFYAVKNLSLKVKKGEILGIVGVNGSGKSTLLKIISSVITPSNGDVKTKGNLVPLLELGGGFNPEYTGLENIYFYSSIIGLSQKETDLKLQSIIDFAEIGDFINQPLKVYSSGMKARLAFAVSVNINPDILILDEILSVGDELFRRKSFAKMEEFFNAGKTILYVTHSTNSMIQLCTRAIMIDKGQLILDGTPKFVGTAYQKYIFSKPSNRFKVKKEIMEMTKQEQKKLEDKKPHTKETPVNKTIKTEHKSKLTPYFIPNFKPKSTIHYDNYDVKIFDYHIRTIDKKKVNVLIQKQNYTYVFYVSFGIDAEKVRFGTIFKTEKGLEISGVKHPNGDEYIEKVYKGQKFKIEIQFHCSFLPANYYLTTGIFGLVNGKRLFLNRIEDLLVFKVQKDNNDKYWGLISLNQQINVTQIT